MTSLGLYKLDCLGTGYFMYTIGNVEYGTVAISCQHESDDVTIKYIWGTMIILNFQFKIMSVYK